MSKNKAKQLQAAVSKAVVEAIPEAVVAEVKVEKPVKVRKERVKKHRVMYPGLVPDSEGKATVQLVEWPADFDPAVHVRLKRRNFTNEAPFLLKRAEAFEAKAKALREEAELIGKAGSKEEQKNVKRLGKLMKDFTSLLGGMGDELPPDEIEAFLEAAKAAVTKGGKKKEEEVTEAE